MERLVAWVMLFIVGTKVICIAPLAATIVHYNAVDTLCTLLCFWVWCNVQAFNIVLPSPASLIPRPLPDFTGDVSFFSSFFLRLWGRLWTWLEWDYTYTLPHTHVQSYGFARLDLCWVLLAEGDHSHWASSRASFLGHLHSSPPPSLPLVRLISRLTLPTCKHNPSPPHYQLFSVICQVGESLEQVRNYLVALKPRRNKARDILLFLAVCIIGLFP